MDKKCDTIASFPIEKLRKIEKRTLDCKIDSENRRSIFSTISATDKLACKDFLGLDSNDRIINLRDFLEKTENFEHQTNRCLGSYLGMVLGDYLGAPIEFIDAVNNSDSIQFVDSSVDASCVKYTIMRNVFNLETGQWTDDAAMGACLADTLLVHNNFNGSDTRCRFWNWWACGYNNAFSLSQNRNPNKSVGLGGNISKSIAATNGKSFAETPAKYTSPSEDSGNGGLMRLAAVPVFYASNPV